MYELALFAGVGGGLLATKWMLGWRTVCYVEIHPYRVEVLKARIRDGLLDDAPIWGDVRTFDGRPWRGCVDVVTAGFPCQPFSVAGRLEAQNDSRNLWPDTIRVIREVRPAWCLLENVTGLLSGSHGYFGQILRDLAESRYDARWKVLSAAEVGAPHKRDRLWIVAHADSRRGQGAQDQICAGRTVAELRGEAMAYAQSEREATTKQSGCRHGSVASGPDVAYPHGSRELQLQRDECSKRGWIGNGGQDVLYAGSAGLERERPARPVGNGDRWAVEPDVGRVANGIPYRVDRIAALGNGQVPAVVATIWDLIGKGAQS